MHSYESYKTKKKRKEKEEEKTAIGILMGGPIGITMAHDKTDGQWEFQLDNPVGISMGLSEKTIGNPVRGE